MSEPKILSNKQMKEEAYHTHRNTGNGEYQTWSLQFGDYFSNDLFNGTFSQVKREYARLVKEGFYAGLEARACLIDVDTNGQSVCTNDVIFLNGTN